MDIQWLLERMGRSPAHEAIVCQGRAVSYGALLDSCRVWEGRLKQWAVEPGEVVAIEADYSPEACGALLALIANGNIVVPCSSASAHKFKELADIAEVQKCLRFADNRVEIAAFGRTPRHEKLRVLSASGQSGLVLFSSGSTGTPKGILHNMDKFLDRYKTRREPLRTLTFLLFDHIGGLNTLFHTLSNGGTVICPADRSPHEICSLIEKHRVELLPATPSFLNMLLMTDTCSRFDLSSLKIITYGTEVMPEHTLRKLRQALPGIQFRQTYGLSELGILRVKSQASDSLWVKVGGEGTDTKIVDGLLYVKARGAMEGYLNAPDPFDRDGWFNTEDQVIADGEFIRILGRASEIINVGGRKVYPAEVEGVLLQMPEVADAVVKGRSNPLLGNVVSAAVNVRQAIDARELKRRMRSFCKDKLESYQIPVYVSIQTERLVSDRFKKIRRPYENRSLGGSR